MKQIAATIKSYNIKAILELYKVLNIINKLNIEKLQQLYKSSFMKYKLNELNTFKKKQCRCIKLKQVTDELL